MRELNNNTALLQKTSYNHSFIFGNIQPFNYFKFSLMEQIRSHSSFISPFHRFIIAGLTGADWGINRMSTSSSASPRSLHNSLVEFISSHWLARFG